VHDEKRTIFEPSNIKVIFVGFSETSKAYRIYILSHMMIVVIRDAKFDENA